MWKLPEIYIHVHVERNSGMNLTRPTNQTSHPPHNLQLAGKKYSEGSRCLSVMFGCWSKHCLHMLPTCLAHTFKSKHILQKYEASSSLSLCKENDPVKQPWQFLLPQERGSMKQNYKIACSLTNKRVFSPLISLQPHKMSSAWLFPADILTNSRCH